MASTVRPFRIKLHCKRCFALLSESFPHSTIPQPTIWRGMTIAGWDSKEEKLSPEHILVGYSNDALLLVVAAPPTVCATWDGKHRNKRWGKKQKQISHSHAIKDAPLSVWHELFNVFRASDVDYEKLDLNISRRIYYRRELFAVALSSSRVLVSDDIREKIWCGSGPLPYWRWNINMRSEAEVSSWKFIILFESLNQNEISFK